MAERLGRSDDRGVPDGGIIDSRIIDSRIVDSRIIDPGFNNRADDDRRRNRRFACGGEVKISRLPSDGIFVPARILDLSLGGCRVDINLPMDRGVRTELLVRVKDATFRAVGEVKAIRGTSMAGIEFVRLGGSGKDILADLVEELARRQAAMKKLRNIPRDVEAREFRAHIDEGKARAQSLSRDFPSFGRALSSESSAEELGPISDAAAEARKAVEASPLVLTVDLFA
jgi:PilZ domain